MGLWQERNLAGARMSTETVDGSDRAVCLGTERLRCVVSMVLTDARLVFATLAALERWADGISMRVIESQCSL